jgi:hypothetical protein
MAERKSPQQVAQENLELAERVYEKSQARVEKTRSDYEKAVQNNRLNERKVRAARMIALDEDVAADDGAETEPETGDDQSAPGDDVL